MKQIYYEFAHATNAEPCEAIRVTHFDGKQSKAKVECVELEIAYDNSPNVTLALSKQAAIDLASQLKSLI
jgi:hypothetical protein